MPALSAMFQALTSGGAVQLRFLDVSRNELGRTGAAAVAEAARKFPALVALCAEGNGFGGRPGVGAIVDVALRAPALIHLGITLDESAAAAAAPGTAAAAPKAGSKTPNRATTPGRTTPGAKPAAKAAGSGAAASTTSAATAGTAAQLAALARAHPLLTSLDLTASIIARDSLQKVLAAFTPPPAPQSGTSSTTSLVSASAAAGGTGAKSRSSTPGRAGATNAKTSGKTGAATAAAKPAAAKSSSRLPLLGLSLASCHVGAFGAQDVSVAMSPAPPSGSPLFALGVVTGAAASFGATAPAAPAPVSSGSKTPGRPASRGRSTAVAAQEPTAKISPAVSATSTFHAALAGLRYLNLSGCGLSSLGALPILEAVALHARFLTHLILRNNNLDDAGAGALATALRINAARIAQARAEQAAVAASAGSTPLQAVLAGMAPTHWMPVSVVDVRNNPLSRPAGTYANPGCDQLVAAIADLPHVITVTGPEPSTESVVALSEQLAAAATQAAEFAVATGSGTNVSMLHRPAPSPVQLVGIGARYMVNLADVRAHAEAALYGRAGPPGSHPHNPLLLQAPPAVADQLARACLRRVDEAEAALAERAALRPALGAGPLRVAWRSAATSSLKIRQRPAAAGSPTLFASFGRQPDDLDATHVLPAHLVSQQFVLAASLPEVLIADGIHGPSSRFSRGGVASPLPPFTPSLYFEWRATYAVDGEAGSVGVGGGDTAASSSRGAADALFANVSVVWHVAVLGPGGRPLRHVASAAFIEGSRDRAHARLRADERVRDAAAWGRSNAWGGTRAATETRRSDGGSDEVWNSAMALHVPHYVGMPDESAAPRRAFGVSGAAADAGKSPAAGVLVFPLAWHAVSLPYDSVAAYAGHRLGLWAELIAPAGSVAAAAASGVEAVVSVMEAEVVTDAPVRHAAGIDSASSEPRTPHGYTVSF